MQLLCACTQKCPKRPKRGQTPLKIDPRNRANRSVRAATRTQNDCCLNNRRQRSTRLACLIVADMDRINADISAISAAAAQQSHLTSAEMAYLPCEAVTTTTTSVAFLIGRRRQVLDRTVCFTLSPRSLQRSNRKFKTPYHTNWDFGLSDSFCDLQQ